MGGKRRQNIFSSSGLLLMLLVLQSPGAVIHAQEASGGSQVASVRLDNDTVVIPPDRLYNDTVVSAPDRLDNDKVVNRAPDRLDKEEEVVAVSGDAEFEARKPRGLLAALFGYPDEFENVDPSSSSAVADASYSVNHEDGESGTSNGAGRRGTPAPQFKASQYALSKKMPSSVKAVTSAAPKTAISQEKSILKKGEQVNSTMKLVEDGNNDADNFTVTLLTAPIVEVRNVNETELNVTIIKEVDEDGNNSTRTERSSGNKREAMPSMEKETVGRQNVINNEHLQRSINERPPGTPFPPQPLPAGYILWHPVPASFLGAPNMPNIDGDDSAKPSNNGPVALASEGSPMFMGPPPHRENGGPSFHPHRPFFVERNFGGNNGPFPITQFSTPHIFAVPPGGPLNQNGPDQEDVKDNKQNRSRERKERNRKKKGGKKNRPKNNEEHQDEDQRNKQPEEQFQRPPPLHLMLPPLPPDGFPNSPFMHQPHNQPQEPEHSNHNHGSNGPPPSQFNRDFPPPMHPNGPPHPQFNGQERPPENVVFRNGNNERGPPNNMHFNQNNDQFHQAQATFPRPSPSPSAHPVKFEIDHHQRLQEQQFHERQRPPPHHSFQPPAPQHFHGPPPNFQPHPPMQQQNRPSAPNFQAGGFHHSSPPHQNLDVPPIRPIPPARPTPNFQQFPEAKPATRPMASQNQQQQLQAASEPPSFATTSHNSHSQSLPDVPAIHFGSSPSPFPPIRSFGGANSFAGPPPFHPPPPTHLGLDRSHFGIPNQNKEDSLIYARDFTKSLAEATVAGSTSSPFVTSNHLVTTDSPNSRITTTSPTPSTFGLPVTAFKYSASPRPGPTSPLPTGLPKPFGLFSSTPHPHQLSPAASHRLPQTHPNLPDYKPSSSTIRTSTTNGVYNSGVKTTTVKSSLPASQDSYPSPGFHTGHKGYPSSVTAPNYVTSSEVPFHTTVAPPPRVSATAKSHYFHTSTSSYGTRPRGNNRATSLTTNDPNYEIQYQSQVPVTSTYSPITSRSSTSPPGVDVSPAYQLAQAQGGSYKPGTSRILLEMGPWNTNDKRDDQQQQ